MRTEDVARRHPDYSRRVGQLDTIELLYCGGGELERKASTVLMRRPKEVTDVWEARIRMFNYQNILGPAIGWYESALFAKNAAVDEKRNGETLKESGYAEFVQNCDRQGSTITDFFRRVFVDAALYRRSYVLVDLPATAPEQFGSLKDQKEAGALDAYLVRYDPRQVINWSTDAFGAFEWVVLEWDAVERSFGAKDKSYRYWRKYDREEFVTFRAEIGDGGKPSEEAQQVDKGPHALSTDKMVPFHVMDVGDGLWLGNRAYLPAKAHLNKTNALDWGMFMACLPIPWIRGGVSGNSATVSEAAYLELADDGEVGYLEPSGTAFEHQAKSIESLRAEIYRQLHLQAQGRSTEATPAAQSGYSKEMDMAPANDVLGRFGDTVRVSMVAVLDMVAKAKGDAGVAFAVRGFEVTDGDAQSDVSLVGSLEMNGCPSPTLVKAAWKRVAREVAPDEPEEFYGTVDSEIESGVKTPEEKARAEHDRMVELTGMKLKGRGAN